MSKKRHFVAEVTNLTGSRLPALFLKRAANECLRTLNVKKTVSVVLAGDKKVKTLNKIYRHKNKVTDVLSFGGCGDSDFLGEIVICLPQARRQAKKCGAPVKAELTRLLIHGLLHLAGYDHDKSRSAARKMFSQQEIFLKKLT